MSISLSAFADQVNEVMPVIAREVFRRQPGEFAKMKITMPQFAVLDLLAHQGQSRMTDIAHFMSVTTAAMTGIVERLVRDGYAARIHDPSDRRIVKVELTAKGKKLTETITDQRRKMIMDLFGKISQGEREEYLKILMHIRDHVAERRGR